MILRVYDLAWQGNTYQRIAKSEENVNLAFKREADLTDDIGWLLQITT